VALQFKMMQEKRKSLHGLTPKYLPRNEEPTRFNSATALSSEEYDDKRDQKIAKAPDQQLRLFNLRRPGVIYESLSEKQQTLLRKASIINKQLDRTHSIYFPGRRQGLKWTT
jgi:hypothetical protein